MPTRHEEEAEQEALEGLHLGLHDVAVGRVGQRHAGKEGAERERQADAFGRRAGGQHDEQRDDGEGLAVVGGGERLEERAHHKAAGEDGDGERDDRLGEDDEHVMPRTFGSRAERGREGQDEDRDDVLRDEHGGGRASHRAARLVAVGEDAGDDGGGGQGQRDADEDGDRPRKAEAPADGAKAAPQRMICSGARPIMSSRRGELAEREVQADVEQQEDDAEIGEEGGGVVVLDEAEAGRADDQPGHEIAHDGAQADGARGEGGGETRAEVDDGGLQGFDGGHVCALPPCRPLSPSLFFVPDSLRRSPETEGAAAGRPRRLHFSGAAQAATVISA